jgi:hypothetical protein
MAHLHRGNKHVGDNVFTILQHEFILLLNTQKDH